MRPLIVITTDMRKCGPASYWSKKLLNTISGNKKGNIVEKKQQKGKERKKELNKKS